MTDNIVKFPDRHGQAGYSNLADLTQGQSIEEITLSTGWWEMDELWKLYQGQFTVVTGIAGSGKSTFLLNVICNMARCNGMGTRSFLYVPENELFLRSKIKKIWGNEKGWEHFVKNQCFVQSAMVDRYDEPPHTLQWVLDQAVLAVEHDHCDVLLIDPWNELERCKPRDMSMPDYIGQCLMYIKQFARAMKVSVILVARPTKAGIADGKVPGLSDIEEHSHGTTNATTA